MAGHHVRMNPTAHRRCTECSVEFVADPRVGDRQVTCGAKGCQRARHAKQCRNWFESNRDSQKEHYQDVVVPFRRRQPDYQSRWRWGRKLREIREQMGQLGCGALGALRSLAGGVEKLVERARSGVQTGVLAGEKLEVAASLVRRTIAALEELAASTVELEALGL